MVTLLKIGHFYPQGTFYVAQSRYICCKGHVCSIASWHEIVLLLLMDAGAKMRSWNSIFIFCSSSIIIKETILRNHFLLRNMKINNGKEYIIIFNLGFFDSLEGVT